MSGLSSYYALNTCKCIQRQAEWLSFDTTGLTQQLGPPAL